MAVAVIGADTFGKLEREALAYLRGWGWLAAAAMGVWGICAPVDHVSVPLCIGIALVAVLTFEAWIGSWWIGRRRVNRPLAALTLTAPVLGLAARVNP